MGAWGSLLAPVMINALIRPVKWPFESNIYLTQHLLCFDLDLDVRSTIIDLMLYWHFYFLSRETTVEVFFIFSSPCQTHKRSLSETIIFHLQIEIYKLAAFDICWSSACIDMFYHTMLLLLVLRWCCSCAFSQNNSVLIELWHARILPSLGYIFKVSNQEYLT